MASRVSYASGRKPSSRTKPSGTAIRTTGPDKGSPDFKSIAMASSDWRKRVHAMSSPIASIKKLKHSSDTSDATPGRLGVRDSSFTAPQYRYPRQANAQWENVYSAPVWQGVSSSSTVSEHEPADAIKVQLKQVKPVMTTLNGEDMTLPNRYSIDVAAVNPQAPPPGRALGNLHRLHGSNRYRPMRQEDTDFLLIGLQQMVNNLTGDRVPVDPTSLDPRGSFTEQRPAPEQKASYRPTPAPSASENSSDEETETPEEKEARFLKLLGRLQKNEPPSQPAQSNGTRRASPGLVVLDPAIVAMKVGHKERGDPDTHGEIDKEAANMFLAQQLSQMRDVGSHPTSADSGYASNERGGHSAGQTVRQSSTEDSQPRTLNPAAAEFKSASQDEHVPWLVPKRMSRQPLSNIFPDALLSHGTQQPEATNDARGQEAQAEKATEAVTAAPTQDQPAAHATRTAAESVSSGPAPSLLPTESRPRQMAQPMAVATALPTPTLPDAPLLPAYGALPAAAALGATVDAPGMGLTTAGNVFHTFPPPTLGIQTPILYHTPGQAPQLGTTATYPTTPRTIATAFVPVPLPLHPMHLQQHLHQHHQPQQPQLQAQQPQQQAQPALVAASTTPGLAAAATVGRQPAPRPYFPVTTKPRDRDPVRQQLYEEYLEWRKANEPGYHMSCKMRQANRVMRQCQLQQREREAREQREREQREREQQQREQRQCERDREQRGAWREKEREREWERQ